MIPLRLFLTLLVDRVLVVVAGLEHVPVRRVLLPRLLDVVLVLLWGHPVRLSAFLGLPPVQRFVDARRRD